MKVTRQLSSSLL